VHHRQIGVLADGIRCDQPCALDDPGLDHGARVLEPIADQIGEAGQSAVVERANCFRHRNPKATLHQLRAQVGRIADDDVRRRPIDRCLVIGDNGVLALYGVERL
jgi:hypothetical protein